MNDLNSARGAGETLVSNIVAVVLGRFGWWEREKVEDDLAPFVTEITALIEAAYDKGLCGQPGTTTTAVQQQGMPDLDAVKAAESVAGIIARRDALEAEVARLTAERDHWHHEFLLRDGHYDKLVALYQGVQTEVARLTALGDALAAAVLDSVSMWDKRAIDAARAWRAAREDRPAVP